MAEPLPETRIGEDMQGNEGTPLMIENISLSDTIMNDELLPPMLSSVLGMYGVGEQASLPFEQSSQTETGLPVNSILNEIHL